MNSPTPAFAAVAPARAADEIARQIRELVASGQIKPGDRLPSERDLAQRLHVSRNTLREALRAGKCVTVGFVNHGYWKNRLDILFHGRKPRNEVYTTMWYESRPANPVLRLVVSGRALRPVRRMMSPRTWRAAVD